MDISHIILDYDGTLTDPDKTSEEYKEVYAHLLCEALGIPIEAFAPLYDAVLDKVQKDPIAGWVIAGKRVCPISDIYILHNAASYHLIQDLSSEETNGPSELSKLCHDLLHDDNRRSEFLGNIFHEASLMVPVPFREGIKPTQRFLTALLQNYGACIVTNSDPVKVERQLSFIGGTSAKIPVVGNAKKYMIDASFMQVPESFQPPSFPLPVMLRRNHYHAVLQQLQHQGFLPEKTLVVGDIYELDLALPEHLGYSTLQMINNMTPSYEKGYVHENRLVATDYDTLLQAIQENNPLRIRIV